MITFDTEEAIAKATDEGMRKALVMSVGLLVEMAGSSEADVLAAEGQAGAVFDAWLAKRDLDIYDQAYAHGFIEGSEQV